MRMYNLRRSHLCITLFRLRHHIACQLHKGHTSHRVFVEGSRCSCIATLADALYDRNLSEQRHIQLFCQTLGSFLTKQVIFVFPGSSAGVNQAMFSTRPRIGTFTLSLVYMLIPLRASANATCCGVLTITAPVMANVCNKVR